MSAERARSDQAVVPGADPVAEPSAAAAPTSGPVDEPGKPADAPGNPADSRSDRPPVTPTATTGGEPPAVPRAERARGPGRPAEPTEPTARGEQAEQADQGDDGATGPTAGRGREEDGIGGRIRPYALTGGRTRSADDLPLETLVVRTAAGTAALPVTAMERRKILDLCERPLSIAEISAYVGVHLGVARVLVGDMKVEGLLDVHRLRAAGDRPDIKLLERVLDGLQAL